MENKANYTLVGLFATVVVVALVGFIYWFMVSDSGGERESYEIVFEGSVSGLNPGTSVLFNGLPVGTVSNVRIDPDNPEQVLARILVDEGTPVREDTQARLEVQGLTGGANVQLLGGSSDAEPLAPGEGDTVAVLRGQSSDIQALLEGARDIVESAESSLSRIDQLIGDNQGSVANTLSNIEALSGSLAQFTGNMGEGQGEGPGFQTMVASLQDTIESANTTFGRIESLVTTNAASLDTTLSNARQFSEILAANSDGLNTFLAGLGEAGAQIGPLTEEIRGLSGDMRALVAAVPPEQLAQSVAGLERTIASADETFARVGAVVETNAETVNATLANTQAFSDILAANSDGLNSFLAGLGESGDQIGPLTQDIRAVSRDLRALVAAVPPERIASSVEGLERTIANADTALARVAGIFEGNAGTLEAAITDAGDFAEVLSANSGNINSFLAGLSQTGNQLGPLTSNLRTLSGDLRTLVAAVPPEELAQGISDLQSAAANANQAFSSVNTLIGVSRSSVTAAVESAEAFSVALASNAEGVSDFLSTLTEAGEQIAPLTEDARLLSSDLRNLVASVPTEGLAQGIEDLQGAAANANQVLANVNTWFGTNADDFAATIENAQTFSVALAANAEGVETFLSTLTDAGEQIGPLAQDARLLSSDLRNLVASVPTEGLAQGIEELQGAAANANSALARIAQVVEANAESVSDTLTGTSQFARVLSANAEGIDSFLQGLGQAGGEIGPLSQNARLLSSDLRELVASVPAEDLAQAIADLQGAADSANGVFAQAQARLAGNAENIDQTLANVRAFSEVVADNAERVDTLVANLAAGSQAFEPIAENVRDLSGDARALVAAVPPEQIAQSVSGLSETIATANTAFARIDRLVDTSADSLASTIESAETFSLALAANAEGVQSFLGALAESSDQVAPLAQEFRLLTADVRRLVEAVPPLQVEQTFNNVTNFADSLARNTENIDAFFGDARRLANNLSGVSDGLQSTLALIDEASSAIDAQIIANAMDNIDAFSLALGSNAANIDEILGNTRDLSATLSNAANQIDTIIARVDGLVSSEGGESMFGEIGATASSFRELAENIGEQTGAIADRLLGRSDDDGDGEIEDTGTSPIEEIGATATSIRALASSLDSRTEQITQELLNFANAGLGDYSELASQARATLQQLQRILAEIERNPQVVVFGGDSVRDFQR